MPFAKKPPVTYDELGPVAQKIMRHLILTQPYWIDARPYDMSEDELVRACMELINHGHAVMKEYPDGSFHFELTTGGGMLAAFLKSNDPSGIQQFPRAN